MQLLFISLRLILGLILLAAAIGKLLNMRAFQLSLGQYNLPHEKVLRYLAPIVELVAGLSLLAGEAVVISSLVSLLLFISILGLYMTMYGKKLKHGCGCFGSKKTVAINTFEIGKIALLILLSAAVFALHLIHCL
jgi:uncharacterized membrane protein YphA (DoxX/SURF4 family)